MVYIVVGENPRIKVDFVDWNYAIDNPKIPKLNHPHDSRTSGGDPKLSKINS